MRLFLWAFCLVLFVAGAAPAAPLDPLLTIPNLWTLKQADFESLARTHGFDWNSASHDSASAGGKDLSIFGMPAVEAVVRFEADALKEISIALYARGDAGNLTKEQYEQVIRNAVESLNRSTGMKFTSRGKDAANAVKADGIFWSTPQAYYLLEYSATKQVKTRDIAFRAEFVRLEITSPPKTKGLAARSLSSGKFSGPQHLQKDVSTGDVLIPDVPMVDQGQKGYCVVATAERVMRYYGSQVDANELAQIANSDADTGTSYEGMLAALKKVGSRLKVRVRQVEEIDVRQILGLVKDYNRAAKKADFPEIPDPGRNIDISSIYRVMQPEVLKEVRTKNKADISKFQREVQQHIDRGIPLVWSVQLGIVKEPGIPQNSGGHMRLIIGYNIKTSEILFSDSWGAGHELKRMSNDDAWTITVAMAAIEPL